MIDSLTETMQQFIEAAKNNGGWTTITLQNHLECLKLYDSGWKQDGFEYIPNSNNIIVFWGNGTERKNVILNLQEQQLWVRELDRRKSQGRI